jgi:general stress protein 26
MPTLAELAAKTKTATELWLRVGRPSGATATYPMWFVHDGERLYALSAESSSEVWDLKATPEVEVAIGSAESADRLKMRADIMTDPNWVPMMIDMLKKKYETTQQERMAKTAEAAKSGHIIIKLKPV